jgi:hypothetical protein
MEYLPLILSNYAWLILWFAVAMIQGLALWGVFDRARDPSASATWPNPELAVFFTVATGIAAQIVVLILLALFQLLSPWPIFLVQLGLTLASIVSVKINRSLWEDFARTFRVSLAEWLRIVPILLLILPWVILPLNPPGGSDPLTYHLPYARFFLENGGLAVNEALRFPLHTHSINLLYAVGMIRPGATMPQLMHAGMAYLALIGVYGMARYWNGWITGILAVAGVLLFKEVQLSFQYAFVDNGLVLFVTAAFLALAFWVENRQSKFLIFGAVFAGTAMGVKYHGAMFTVPLGLMVLWFSRDLKLTVKFALLTSAFGLFWYIRSWWISGNPVHPFASDLFGYYIWTAEDLAGQMNELRGHGVDRDFMSFWQLPEKMFSEKMKFNGATGRGGILTGVFLASLLLMPWQKPAVRALQLAGLAWLVFWFQTSHVIRYLFPVLPLMGLVAWTAWGRVISAVFKPLKKNNPDIENSGRFLQDAFLLPFFLLFLLIFCVQEVDEDLSYPRLTPEQQSAFMIKWQPSYELMKESVEDGRVGDGPVLQFRLPQSKYFFPGKVYGDWMGQFAYHKFGYVGPQNLWVINDPEILYGQILELGVKAVAMKTDPAIQFAPMDLDRYRTHFEFISETEYGIVMIPRPEPRSPAEQ